MRIHQLQSPYPRKNRKRVGRGDGSGHGSYSGGGVKGQKSRSGSGPRPGFEGGQTPLVKRLPQLRGFTPPGRKEYHVVKLATLARLPESTDATPETMLEHRLVNDLSRPIKVLGDGKVSRPIKVSAHKFTRSAREKLLAAGGSVTEL